MHSSSQIITTNKPTSSFFTGQMTFLSPNQQCQKHWRENGIAIYYKGRFIGWGLTAFSAQTGYIKPVFIEAKDDGGGDNWTTGSISRAKLQPIHHHQQTNIQFFTGQMTSCRPTNNVKALKGKISHSMDLLTPSSPRGLPTLSLTTNSSWLPWGGLPTPHQPSDASTP